MSMSGVPSYPNEGGPISSRSLSSGDFESNEPEIIRSTTVKKSKASKVVLLIGESQNGKSALANVLVHGSVDPAKNTFKIGDGTGSCTRMPVSGSCFHQYVSRTLVKAPGPGRKPTFQEQLEEGPITVIDTPGVGDTTNESSSMLSLYLKLDQLQKQKEQLACVVLVIKYPTFMSEAFKRNIVFYRRLFPQIFEENAVLVITAYQQDERWHTRQLRTGTEPHVTLAKIRSQVEELLGQTTKGLQLFTCESLADDLDPIELAHNKLVRKNIFDRCFTVPGVSLAAIRFPKPQDMLEADRTAAANLQARQGGITKGLEVAESALAKAAGEMSRKFTEITNAKALLSDMTHKLEEIDNDGEVTIAERHFDRSWAFLWWASAKFSETFGVDISSKTWLNGAPQYDAETERQLAGVVYSPWMSSLDARLTVRALSREVHAITIQERKEHIRRATADLHRIQLEYQSYSSSVDGNKVQLVSLRKELDSIEDQVGELLQENLPLENIIARLDMD